MWGQQYKGQISIKLYWVESLVTPAYNIILEWPPGFFNNEQEQYTLSFTYSSSVKLKYVHHTLLTDVFFVTSQVLNLMNWWDCPN